MLLRSSYLGLALLAAGGCASVAADHVSAAGVVAYTRVGDTTYLLIADHRLGRARGWGAFGGMRDDDETTAAAALREFHEETRCAYLGAGLQLDETQPHVDVGGYRSYALEVAYREPAEFLRDEVEDACAGIAGEERGPWAWVPKEELLAAIRTAAPGDEILLPERYVPDPRRRWVWPKSAVVIERSEQRGLLP